MAGRRPAHAPLLVRGDGTPWAEIDLVMFRQATARAEVDASVTPYAMRHSSIVRQLVRGVPVRIVAASHDTSVTVLEKVYSRHIIGDQTDAITRAALLDVAAPPAGNVIPLAGR